MSKGGSLIISLFILYVVFAILTSTYPTTKELVNSGADKMQEPESSLFRLILNLLPNPYFILFIVFISLLVPLLKKSG